MLPSMSSNRLSLARGSCLTKALFFRIDFDGFWLILGTSIKLIPNNCAPSPQPVSFNGLDFVGLFSLLSFETEFDWFGSGGGGGENATRFVGSVFAPENYKKISNFYKEISLFVCLNLYQIDDKYLMDYLWFHHHCWSWMCIHLTNDWIGQLTWSVWLGAVLNWPSFHSNRHRYLLYFHWIDSMESSYHSRLYYSLGAT